YDINNTVVVEKTVGKDFKILNLTDIQFNDTLDIGKRKMTEKTIADLIAKENPDLITITGDLVWASINRQSIKDIIKIMESYKILWAPVFGNHDGDGNSDFNWFADRLCDENLQYCLFKRGPSNIGGLGNYIVNIVEAGKIVESLVLLDSGASRSYANVDESQFFYDIVDGKQKQVGHNYDFLKPGQIEWYEWAIKGANAFNNNGKNVDSTLLFHIALVEFYYAYNEWRDGGFDPLIGFGEKNEDVCCPKINSGMYKKVVELGSTKNIVVGHDHNNNFSVLTKDGVRLSYGLKTGDRCYNKAHLNGGSVLIVDGNGVRSFAHSNIAE
ncbi:MAG: metallophosphoesterase, partial [Clostridia bacterium]